MACNVSAPFLTSGAGWLPSCLFRTPTGDFQSSQTERVRESELGLNESTPSIEEALPLASAEPTETQNTPEINLARRGPWELAVGVPTSHQRGPPAVLICVPPCWGGGAPHRHRQSADTAPLVKPTCSPVTPAIWASHRPTHRSPLDWAAAPNLTLYSEPVHCS